MCPEDRWLWRKSTNKQNQTNLFEFLGVLRHMQRYFSRICDGTDVQPTPTRDHPFYTVIPTNLPI